jgi:hypothetical protein
MKTCKCIKEAQWITIGAGKGKAIVTFSVNNTYQLEISTHEVFGDCYSVTDNQTGFVANYSKDKFDTYFQEI